MILSYKRIPPWIRVKIPAAGPIKHVESTLRRLNLNTVCENALCPNQGSCFEKGTATFMILGSVCTRNCPFCAVAKGKPEPVDESEPFRVAEAVKILGLRHVVITSVDRDDLLDRGAGHFAATVRAIRSVKSDVTIELLVPDFGGSKEAVDIVLDAEPTVLNHNLETVRRLHQVIKPKSSYQRSLWLLKYVKDNAPNLLTKSGLMVGLGETDNEVLEAIRDIRATGCDILTIGQYLKPPN
ncbi:MAG: lipoyl synthase, partial [Nitrososphaerales archaeon]